MFSCLKFFAEFLVKLALVQNELVSASCEDEGEGRWALAILINEEALDMEVFWVLR